MTANLHGVAGLEVPPGRRVQPAPELAPTFSPAWLRNVLASHALLDLESAAAREVLAAAVLAAIPAGVIVACIRESATAVLKVRGIIDGEQEIARELANNAAQSVLLMLEVDE